MRFFSVVISESRVGGILMAAAAAAWVRWHPQSSNW
jgi:hypothetical protein